MAKIRVDTGSIAKRLLHPRHAMELLKLTVKRTRHARVFNDAQLTLYSELLDSDFLHYGYFDDPSIAPDLIRFRDLKTAQNRYAEKILEKISRIDSPVLDVGCGMGGLSRMCLERGLQVTALTPDRAQCRFIRSKLPTLELIESRYEDLDGSTNKARFGTVLMSESFQYINVPRAIELTDQILVKDGTWLICDYFRIGEAKERSGHSWDSFQSAIENSGKFKITEAIDITPNILPTIAYAHFLGKRLALPILKFVSQKLETKRPSLHYLLAELLEKFQTDIQSALDVVDPELFAQSKSYRLLTLERVH